MDKSGQIHENIKIIIRENKPIVRVEAREGNKNSNSITVRILFTLTGTCNRNIDLQMFSSHDFIPYHANYTSVGIIEEVGSNTKLSGKGKLVLLPAQFSKYIDFTEKEYLKLKRKYFSILPRDLDPVDALFLPFICVALDIVSRIQEEGLESILFLGCGLLGAILLKILDLDNIHPIIYLDEKDIDSRLLFENGAKHVFENGSEIAQDVKSSIKEVFVLSKGDWVDNIKENILYESVNYTDLWAEEGEFAMCYDTQLVALDLLRNNQLYLKDLIAQHIHAEAAMEACNSIKDNFYKGKSLIYDW